MTSINQGSSTPPPEDPFFPKPSEENRKTPPVSQIGFTRVQALPIVSQIPVLEGAGAMVDETLSQPNVDEIVSDVASSKIFSEQLEGLVGRLQSLLTDLESSQLLFQKVQVNLQKLLPAVRTSSPSGGTDKESIERLMALRRNYDTILQEVLEFKKLASNNLSKLADLHGELQGVNYSQFLQLCENGKEVLRQLSVIGLDSDGNGNWHISNAKGAGKLLLVVENMHVHLQKMNLPSVTELSAKMASLNDSKPQCDPEVTKSLSYCERLLNELRRLWAMFIDFISICYDNICFVLMWLARRLGLLSRGKASASFHNPDASSEQPFSSSSSSMARKGQPSKRSDLSDEEMITRPDSDSVNSESSHSDDRDNLSSSSELRDQNQQEGEKKSSL
ncbi:hypothetical protein C10C_0453 [Chlamydia serpentis]|uniref:Uncharacterized protein n=1 Tax=Chlamydia serpentis TaxID=1967782 RepID=A0A2R8FB17_9CHLA|nr:hypothetical protein [Chlamydia serpentis]SPN73619.1 hypothetical protein C10C_0453 [Chlamydia serpentis]